MISDHSSLNDIQRQLTRGSYNRGQNKKVAHAIFSPPVVQFQKSNVGSFFRPIPRRVIGIRKIAQKLRPGNYFEKCIQHGVKLYTLFKIISTT